MRGSHRETVSEQITPWGSVPTIAGELRAEFAGGAGSLLRVLKRFAVLQPMGAVAAVIIVVLALVALFAPLVAPSDPYRIHVKGIFAGVGEDGYLLGGDEIGRDVLSWLIYGARISLYVSLASTVVGITIGSTLGIISATRAGKTDMFLQRIIDALMAFPSLILALAIMATLGASLENVILAISITIISPTSRAVRSQALSVAAMDYVTVARVVGAGYWRIVAWHVLHNCLSLILVLASVTLGAAIIIESSLSFLGLGGPPEEPTWGGMMGGQTYHLLREAPTLIIFPAVAIGLVVFSFNMLGDSLRDMWDPRLRGSR